MLIFEFKIFLKQHVLNKCFSLKVCLKDCFCKRASVL